ncbi:hypothetical protein GY14_26565 [Delftia tsuruhatensis]|nr:hypothetical protein GY14_26565 [Delftia tsuruhatensis]
MPVSCTWNRRSVPSSLSPMTCRRRATWPENVNLMALPTRLSRICRSRKASPTSRGGVFTSETAYSCRPFCSARDSRPAATLSSNSVAENAWASSCSRPASMADRSRLSLTMRSKEADACCMAPR